MIKAKKVGKENRHSRRGGQIHLPAWRQKKGKKEKSGAGSGVAKKITTHMRPLRLGERAPATSKNSDVLDGEQQAMKERLCFEKSLGGGGTKEKYSPLLSQQERKKKKGVY